MGTTNSNSSLFMILINYKLKFYLFIIYYLLILRYIVSDCDSIQVLVDDHKWLGDTKEDAVAQTLKAG